MGLAGLAALRSQSLVDVQYATKPQTTNATKIVPRVHLTTRFQRFRGRFAVGWSSTVNTSFFFRVSCIGFSSASCCFPRQKSELLHQRKLIECEPLLFNFVVHNPPDRNPRLFRFLSGGGLPINCAGVGAARNPVNRDQVAFGDQFFGYDCEVWKCLMPAFQGRLVFIQADISMNAMIDEIFGIKLFSEFKFSFAKKFLECAF